MTWPVTVDNLTDKSGHLRPRPFKATCSYKKVKVLLSFNWCENQVKLLSLTRKGGLSLPMAARVMAAIGLVSQRYHRTIQLEWLKYCILIPIIYLLLQNPEQPSIFNNYCLYFIEIVLLRSKANVSSIHLDRSLFGMRSCCYVIQAPGLSRLFCAYLAALKSIFIA